MSPITLDNPQEFRWSIRALVVTAAVCSFMLEEWPVLCSETHCFYKAEPSRESAPPLYFNCI